MTDRAWSRLPLREQIRQNLAAFFSMHGMHVSHDWPSVRVNATREVDARLSHYAQEREARMQSYWERRASFAYRNRKAIREVEHEPFRREVGR